VARDSDLIQAEIAKAVREIGEEEWVVAKDQEVHGADQGSLGHMDPTLATLEAIMEQDMEEPIWEPIWEAM
jgi:hypothetical protein